MKIHPQARVGIVLSGVDLQERVVRDLMTDEVRGRLPPNVVINPTNQNVDIVYHLAFLLEKSRVVVKHWRPAVQEWFIVNPKIIEWHSADPAVVRDKVLSELAALRRTGFRGTPISERHFFDELPPTGFKKILKETLTQGTAGIPEYFLRGQTARPVRVMRACKEIFSGH